MSTPFQGDSNNTLLFKIAQLLEAGGGGGGGGGVTTFNTRSGAVTLSSADVVAALTYTPAPTISRVAAYGTGTAYAVTSTAAAVAMGTTSPTITITVPGTYLIFSSLKFDENSATFLVNKTLSFKIRRTNNTAADVSNSAGTATADAAVQGLEIEFFVGSPPVIYTTANSTDSLSLFANIDSTTDTGNFTVSAASLVAIRIA